VNNYEREWKEHARATAREAKLAAEKQLRDLETDK